MKLLAMLGSLLISVSVWAGDFNIQERDASGLWVTYTGVVDRYDHEKLRVLMELVSPHTTVFCIIDSPGGSAYGGLNLYYEAEKWKNLVTIAGSDFGAWSAAAIFWLGSPRDFTIPGSKVGFHAAYCNPYFPPGCDTSEFQTILKEVLYREGFEAERFNATLNYLQERFGVDAWLIKTGEGWIVEIGGRVVGPVDIPQTAPPVTKDRI